MDQLTVLAIHLHPPRNLAGHCYRQGNPLTYRERPVLSIFMVWHK